LDFFKDLEDVKSSFRRFAELVPEDKGLVVYNGDDKNTCDALRGLARSAVTFGFDENNDYHPANVTVAAGKTQFDIIGKGENLGRVSLRIPGRHNILNALAAAAALMRLGTAPESIIKGLSSFTGAKRRFEYKGEINGALVYDDYAHHPGELRALLDMVQTLNYKRTVVVFQPHTYSRTAALFDDFVAQLRRPDVLLLAEIFAAREQNTIGISSADLAERIPGANFYASFEDLENALRSLAQPGDIILTVGAGDVYRVGERLVEEK
jgi:UDP-N-acetylmuramate--alanine ligase